MVVVTKKRTYAVISIQKKINYKIYSDKYLFSFVAKSIEEGNVVGWFQDRSEFGPRAPWK